MTDKIKILFLASNPIDTARLRVDKEIRQIDERIQRASQRDRFDLVSAFAVRPGDLQAALLRHKPQIVHFSGHGGGDVGIAMEDDYGQKRLVNGLALKNLFESFKKEVRAVVLNACYSVDQAEGIGLVIDYTVGMKRSIGDESAIVFASFFYQALAFGEPVKKAFNLAKNQLELKSMPDPDVAELFVRKGARNSAIIRPDEARIKNDEPADPFAVGIV